MTHYAHPDTSRPVVDDATYLGIKERCQADRRDSEIYTGGPGAGRCITDREHLIAALEAVLAMCAGQEIIDTRRVTYTIHDVMENL